MDDELKKILGVSNTDQQTAHIRDQAKLVAVYYTSLCAGGVPEGFAVELTSEWQCQWWEYILDVIQEAQRNQRG